MVCTHARTHPRWPLFLRIPVGLKPGSTVGSFGPNPLGADILGVSTAKAPQ